MISRIYSIIDIPKIDRLMPLDAHYVISEYLGFSMHMRIYIRLVHNSEITHVVKEHIYNECYPFFNMYENKDTDTRFEHMVISNLHNIVECYKILPLFYEMINGSNFITYQEHIRLHNLLTIGFPASDNDTDSDSDDADKDVDIMIMYKLCKKPILYEITRQQCMCAFLARGYHFKLTYIGNKMKLKVFCMNRRPSENELIEFMATIKLNILKFTI